MNQLRYTLLSSVVIAGTAMAQWANPRPALMDLQPAVKSNVVNVLPAEPATDLRDGGDIVWSEDFANGLAGNNGVGPWTTSGPNGNIWKRAVSGPLGAYTTVASRIQSLTVANGYMLFNSDSANSTWSGNTPTALDPANFTSWEGSLESPVLDLSSTPFVELVFQQRLRYCCENRPQLLEVSTDGGTTWPTSFDIAVNWPANEPTLSPTETFKVNLVDAIAADPSNVRFRFRHSAEAGSSHYHWQIDDVSIVELYQYDLRLTSSALTSWDPVTAESYDAIRYSIYHTSQLRPIGFNMNVLNNGSEVDNDAVANFTVAQQGGATILDQDQPQATWAPGEQRNIVVDPSFTPPAQVGQYNVSFAVSSSEEDQTPNDNSGTTSFRVSDVTYARDNGSVASVQSSAGGPLIMANAFYIQNATMLYGITVALGTGSEIGALVQGELRADNLDDVIATTEEQFITAGMLTPIGGSNFVNLVFNPPVELTAGIDYMAAVQVFGDVRVGRNGNSEEQTSFLYFEGQAGLDWYFTTTTPIVRMNFDASVGIDELDASNTFGLGQNMPNPANGTTTIPYELKEAGVVSFQMHDVTGKLVMEEFMGSRGAGVYRFDIGTENLREGVYFYTMTVGEARMSKRMIVVR
ncbi:MAG: T9SS type A sorting domain-containing protein [Flavobacteriales bacterium]